MGWRICSLRIALRIVLPPAVKIDNSAFKNCSNLTNMVFRDEIEALVSCEAMRGW
jgi:hypothetical protein